MPRSSATTPFIYLGDELGRVPASPTSPTSANATTVFGPGSIPSSWRPLNLTATDVVTAIAQQNLQVAAGQIGQPPNPSASFVTSNSSSPSILPGPAHRSGSVRRHHRQDGHPGPANDWQAGVARPRPPRPSRDGPRHPAARRASRRSAFALNGPTPPVTGMIRLRDVVRENVEYVMRLRFDPAQLAQRGLRPEDVVGAPSGHGRYSIKEDPDAPPVDGLNPDLVGGDLRGDRATVVTGTGCRRDQGPTGKSACRYTWAICWWGMAASNIARSWINWAFSSALQRNTN